MTAAQLHDALTLLPEDLLLETDRRRKHRKPPIRWTRYAAMAACFALILFAGLFLSRLAQPKGAAEMAVYDAAEEPAAAFQGAVREESRKEAPAEAAPAEQDGVSGSGTPEAELGTTTAAEEAIQDNAANTMARVTLTLHADGSSVTLSERDTDTLRQLLTELSYDPQAVCNCMAEYLLEYPGVGTWEVNLTEGFVRTAQGQATLTEAQADAFFKVIEASLLQEGSP